MSPFSMFAKHSRFAMMLSVPVWESVPGVKIGGQPIRLKLGAKAGCDKIFQKPLWLTSLTVCSGVSWGVLFVARKAPQSSLPGGIFESAIKRHWQIVLPNEFEHKLYYGRAFTS